MSPTTCCRWGVRLCPRDTCTTAEGAVTAHNATITALARHAAVMGATATGSLKDTGQVVGLGSGGTLVGDDGLRRGGGIGKGRDGEEKEEESSGREFSWATSWERRVAGGGGKRKGRAGMIALEG